MHPLDNTSEIADSERRTKCEYRETTYQEVQCRIALNRVRGMPFQWTLAPYRGCDRTDENVPVCHMRQLMCDDTLQLTLVERP